MYELINLDLIKTRIEEWGGEEMVIEIMNMLIDEYYNSIPLIESAVKNVELNKIKELVHPIKSNFYYFVDRDGEFGKKIQEFENKGKFEDPTNLDYYLNYFKTNAEKTLEELQDYMSQLN